MKNYKLYIMSFLFTIFAFFSTASTHAQSAIPMTLDVPFEFYAGDKLLSPGKYTITRISDGAFSFHSVPGDESIIVPTPAANRIKRNVESERIIFSRYGDRYFLRQIFPNRNADGFSLLKSKAEKTTQKEFRFGNKPQKNGFNPEQVAIGLKVK